MESDNFCGHFMIEIVKRLSEEAYNGSPLLRN